MQATTHSAGPMRIGHVMRSKKPKGGPRYQCAKCKAVVQSMYRHDFQRCPCGAIFVDGGTDYTRLGGESENITGPLPEDEP